MDTAISYETLALVTAISLGLGYLLFLLMKRSLPKKLGQEQRQQRERVLQKALHRKKQILEESASRLEERHAINLEELETQIEDSKEDLETQTEEIIAQEEFLEREENRVKKLESQWQSHQAKTSKVEERLKEAQSKVMEERRQLQAKLAESADCKLEQIEANLVDQIVTERTLEKQKLIKQISDEFQTNQKKLADRSLARVLSRYEPRFVWPKPTSHVEITNPKALDALQRDDSRLIQDLQEMCDMVEISISDEKNQHAPVIKLGGGYGMDKEAARLSLEELIAAGPGAWAKSESVFRKHREALDVIAIKLGKQAVNELKLEGIAPEIQRMVGALNWRTSYRQNQFYHSLEVAKLAGVLANELKVDPQYAKRCGLLHDIGKGIDYRIEGSHAVISGDYADRYGEAKIVCDTVMSHHNDLVLETPLSYVLKSADTLSGARPGARVNLEEGYQIRLSSIDEAVRSFPGIVKIAIMNGGREVHIDVNHKKVKEDDLNRFTQDIARKIESDVAFPGQIKVLVTRRFESVAVA